MQWACQMYSPVIIAFIERNYDNLKVDIIISRRFPPVNLALKPRSAEQLWLLLTDRTVCVAISGTESSRGGDQHFVSV